MNAIIALEDGTIYRGISFGAEGERLGEIVFNTSLTGYQEILTDPSYNEQIVTMTYPLIGNYGINSEDVESDRIQVEGLVVDMNTFGFIFAFQVLPTIIFFSALTSLLFYLGVIQKVVKGMAWLLTKTLYISGAESLSVAGNIFLGQTEAPLLIKV